MQAPWGSNFGYHGLVKIQADFETNALKILNNCYWISVNEEVPLDNNNEDTALLSKLMY